MISIPLGWQAGWLAGWLVLRVPIRADYCVDWFKVMRKQQYTQSKLLDHV